METVGSFLLGSGAVQADGCAESGFFAGYTLKIGDMLVLGLVKDGSKEIFIDIEKFVVLIAQIASIFVYLLLWEMGGGQIGPKAEAALMLMLSYF